MTNPAPTTAAFAVLIICLTSLGPLSTDFYLPALPTIAAALGTDSAGAQLTLSAYMIGFGCGQLLLGPLSDRYGRRPVLLWGMAVYVLASVACSFAPDIDTLIAARVLQALGACAGPVLGRAVVRDLYGPSEAARMLSYIAGGTALAPLLGPLLGGWLTVLFGWRSSFVFMTVFSLVLALVTWKMLRESNRHLDPAAMQPTVMLGNYRKLLADPAYRGVLLTGSFSFAALFAFISGAPFVYIELYGMSPQSMAIAFGANVTGFMLGTTLSGRLSRRIGVDRLMRIGVWMGALAGVALAVLALADVGHPLAVIVPMWFITCSTGLVLPNATALGLSGYPHMAGAAASLMGFAQMGCGAVFGAIVGHGVQASAAPMALTVAAGVLLSLAAWRLSVRRAT